MKLADLFNISIEGIDQTAVVAERLISLSMTDKKGLEADELSLTLSDDDARLPFPTKGNKIQLSLAMPDTGVMIDKGSFTIDEAEHSGTPDQIQIRAKSADMKSSLKTKRAESYHGKKLGEIAQTIATRHELKLVIDTASSQIMIDHFDQNRESDINLLDRLCKTHDLTCTIKQGSLLIKPNSNNQSASGKPLASLTITRQDGDSHRYSRADRQSDYEETTASYHDPKLGKTKHITTTKGKVNESDQLPDSKAHVITKPAKNRDEAVAKASAADKDKSRQVAKFDLTLAQGRPDIIADSPVTVTGFRPYIDGHKWTVIEVSHDLSGSGYTSKIQCEASLN